MDAPETQKSLDCDGHAALFPHRNNRFKESPTGGVGTVSSKTQKTTQNISAKSFGKKTFHKIVKHLKKLEPSTFHPLPRIKIPLPQEGFPSPNPSSEAAAVFVLRFHGCLGLEKPLDDQLVAEVGCVVQRCAASGSRSPMAQAPQGRKTLKKLWHIKSRSFGNCGHSNSSVKLRNIATLRCLMAIELPNKNSCLWYSIEAVSVENLTQTYFSYSDTAKFNRNNPIIPLFCVFVPGISCCRLNIRELAYEIQRLWFDSWDLHKMQMLHRGHYSEYSQDCRNTFWIVMGMQSIGKLKSSIEKSPTLKSYFSAAHRRVGNEPVATTKRATHVYPGTIKTL